MPPRLRSKPYGPNSPNAVQGLPDPAPRRRRATRSASAQPQEDQPAPPVREPKTRKTRGKAASRGKKKATRQTSPSPSPAEDPQPDQLEGDETTSGAVVQELSVKTRPDLEIQEQAATPSVEIPVTVLPSIEPSDPELTTPTPGVCELPSFISLRFPPASFFPIHPPPERSSSVDSVASLPIDSSSSTPSISTKEPSNQHRSWFMSKLRSFSSLCTRSHAAPVVSSAASAPSATITAPAVRWSLEIPVFNLNMGHPESALDDIELMSIIRAVRTAGTVPSRRSHRRPRTSPSPSSEQSRVLRAQGATPIHRSRTSYASRSTSRRIESRGSLGRTLYRLPQLLSFSNRPELQDDSGEETNLLDEQDSLNIPPATSVPEATPPSTPKRATAATPVAPMTTPAAGTDVSPGWSRWIFNGVSRRWTVLRGRFTHDHDNENENQPAVAEPTVPNVAASSTEPVLAAPVTTLKTSPAGVLGPSISPKAQRMAPLPRPRRRSMSFVDTRTLLAADGSPSSSDAYSHETQREFVKRRQAARVALEKQKQEAKSREITAAQFAAAAAAAAAHEAARWKQYASSNTPTLPRPFPVTPNKAIIQAPLPTPAYQIDSGSRSRASEVAAAQTANPRKRSRGFGLDEDDLAVHEEDFTPEEWETLKAQVEKAEEEAAKAAQESVPPTKKRRVDKPPKQQKRTQQSVRRQSTTSRPTEPPIRTPGFIPNRRGTLAPPDLSPIDSSRLLTDPDSPSDPQTPPASTQPSETREAQKAASHSRSNSSHTTTAQSRASSSSQTGMILNGVFVPEHQLPNCDLSTQGAWRRTPSTLPDLSWLHRIPTTSKERREKRNKPSAYFSYLRSFTQAREELRRTEGAALQAEAEDAKKQATRRKARETAQNEEINRRWRSQRRESGASVASPSVRFAERLETSRSIEEFALASSSPIPSPRLPSPPRPAIKRKRASEASDPCSPPSPSPKPPSPPRPLKRSRTFEAPDPYASSSSSPKTPLPPVKRSRTFEAPDPYASSSSSSASSASPPSRSPYDAASFFASLRPQPHSPQGGPYVRTDANSPTPQLAAIQDSELGTEAIEAQDPSPLSRARNKAELFKPKTPSRLRESTRIPNSTASTPSAPGLSSPSFNVATPPGNQVSTADIISTDARREDVAPLGPGAFASDPLKAPETDTRASSTAAALNTTESAVNEAVPSLADDVAWLSEILPNGNFDELQWPPRRRLAEVLNICPEAEAIVEQSWPEKGADLVKYFENMFEAYKATPNEFVVAL